MKSKKKKKSNKKEEEKEMDQTNIMGVHRTGHSAVPNDTVGEPSSSF